MAISNLFHIFRGILLAILQALVFNHVYLFDFVNPYLYLAALLWIPVDWNKTAILLYAFALGFVVDIFVGHPGIHAAACVFTAFVRNGLLILLSPREGYEQDTVPSLRKFGVAWFSAYSGILILVHHLSLHAIEHFGLEHLGWAMLRAIPSVIFTFVLVMMTSLFTFNSSKRNE